MTKTMILSFTCLLFFAPQVGATWSIVAADPETGQIGIAGASCTHNVGGIGDILPGVGAVVVQAMSNREARERGVELLETGATPEEIVESMRAEEFDPENQQYAVVTLAQLTPSTYSGTETSGWSGAKTASGVSVQGNILTGEDVADRAMKAFQDAAGQTLAERLVSALVAGAAAGGDSRCGEQRARSAFVTVFNADDHPRRPLLHVLVYGIEEGQEPAVDLLAAQFKRILADTETQQSTRLFIVP